MSNVTPGVAHSGITVWLGVGETSGGYVCARDREDCGMCRVDARDSGSLCPSFGCGFARWGPDLRTGYKQTDSAPAAPLGAYCVCRACCAVGGQNGAG